MAARAVSRRLETKTDEVNITSVMLFYLSACTLVWEPLLTDCVRKYAKSGSWQNQNGSTHAVE